MTDTRSSRWIRAVYGAASLVRSESIPIIHNKSASNVTTMGNPTETGPSNYAGTVKVTIRGREYVIHTAAPLPATPLGDLEDGLERNRAILREAQDKMRDMFELEAFEYAAPAMINYDTPTQDAIAAHINITMLIPLINLKGGCASFEKIETLPVQQRIEIMRNVAEKSVFNEHLMQHNNVHAAFLITFCLVVLLSLVLV